MFNCLEDYFELEGRGRNAVERERRESYAKVAKKNTFENKKFKKVFIFFESFFKSSFATFAQLSRLSRSKIPLLALSALLPLAAHAQTSFLGIGRPATPAEVKAWDIDVRPDFKGLPAGSGSVKRGETVWEAQCASCHGSFAESNEVFAPLAGYTTAKDIETGNVASLQLGSSAPTRTSMMKVSQLSTLWDYINRAMPWTAPKSLSADDVYAVTAYLLNLASVVPNDYTLSDKNIAEVQKRLPNRLGTTTAHALWPGNGIAGVVTKPDVQGSSCKTNCATDPKVASFIPDYARDAHGNLADQSRSVGGSRGAKTAVVKEEKKPVATVVIAQAAPNSVASAKLTSTDVMPTLQKFACAACHGIDTKQVGPSFREVLAKQGSKADAAAYLVGKIKSGGQGVYGQIPMPAQSISEAEAQNIANWIVQGAVK